TLLVQSGKPVGVFKTHPDAPRVLIANSLLVPRWATWEHFWELEGKGLIMFGQMTAGSWIYIGSQGIVQGTFETFAECAGRQFGGSLVGRLVLTAGLGGMGGAQPLAITMNGGVCVAVEVDEARARPRGVRAPCARFDGHAGDRVAGVQAAGHGAVRLRQQSARRGRAGRAPARPGVLVSGLRARVPAAAVLPRQGTVSLGGALG